MLSDLPIGIFDSGIGGLTVAKAISEILPNEQFIYYGDTAHMPYGEKSPDLIKEYATAITTFLVEQKRCKAIVIACNTASALAYPYLKEKYQHRIPIINVIDPMIEYVISDENIRTVGIIATRATIQSGVYQEKFQRRKGSLIIQSLATPLLASMIEEKFSRNEISRVVLNQYLNDPILKGIDALVLACTHYPLIKDEIEEFYYKKVRIIDSAGVVAEKLKWILAKENILSPAKQKRDIFLVSDISSFFRSTAQFFYGTDIHLEASPLKH